MTSDLLRLALIKALRSYIRFTPIAKGRSRAATMVHHQAAALGPGHRMTVRSVDGRRFRLDPTDPQYHMGLLAYGRFEDRETDTVRRWVKRGDIVVDAGACYAWFTTLMSELVGPSGHVHAYEPVPPSADTVAANLALNGETNVTLHRAALGAEPGTITMHVPAGRATGDASMYPASADGKTWEAPRVTLDDAGLTRCDFIKCDVEGAETQFLQGAARVLGTFQPVVMIELNPSALGRAGTTAREVLEELRRYADYRFERLDAAPGTFIEPAECDALTSYINVVAIPPGRLERAVA